MSSAEDKPVKLKGIPDDHPSIGRNVREPVSGPSWPQEKDHGGGRMITPAFEVVWGLILLGWVLYSRFAFICPYFRDPDSIKIAFGIGQTLQGVTFDQGSFYEIEKIWGTYALFEFFVRTFGIDIAGIGPFLSVLCACFMVGIIAISFSLGWMIWGRRVALVSTSILSISPMMWMTGEYITSIVPALFFFMLAVWTMVMSYRVKGGRWWLAVSGLLFALAIIIRLDMLLGMLVPVCYAYFVDRRGLRRALILYGITIIVLLIFWFGILRIPPAEIFSVGPHQPDYGKSVLLNWWGMGPFLFIFAFAGFVYRFVTGRRPLPFLFFWIVGFNTFYTGHLYSARYFIPYYPVVSWLAAFAVIALYGWLVRLVHYNRPMRVLIMLLFIAGALTMLTVSTIKDGDGRTRLAWGETITYTRNDGLSPTGAAWYFMQDFREGEGLQHSWIEDGARHAVEELFDPNISSYSASDSPIYIGNISQPYINYFLLVNGWDFDAVRGPFLNFTTEAPPDWARPPIVQTVYRGDDPIPELSFINTPGTMNLMMGRDAIPQILVDEGEPGAPFLTSGAGWTVGYSHSGLDILMSGGGSMRADGSLQCEIDLLGTFYNDVLPRNHVDLIPDYTVPGRTGGSVTSHNGEVQPEATYPGIERLTELAWTSTVSPDHWLALAVNRVGLLPEFETYVNDTLVEDPIWLAKNIEGAMMSRWDIVLIPPEYLTSADCEFKIEAIMAGSVYNILWVQRNYPDCQFRNETAIPLGLDFAEYDCVR